MQHFPLQHFPKLKQIKIMYTQNSRLKANFRFSLGCRLFRNNKRQRTKQKSPPPTAVIITSTQHCRLSHPTSISNCLIRPVLIVICTEFKRIRSTLCPPPESPRPLNEILLNDLTSTAECIWAALKIILDTVRIAAIEYTNIHWTRLPACSHPRFSTAAS